MAYKLSQKKNRLQNDVNKINQKEEERSLNGGQQEIPFDELAKH